MNKTIFTLIVGLALGAGASWLFLRGNGASGRAEAKPEAAKAEAPEEKGAGVHLAKEQLANAGLGVVTPKTEVFADEVKATGRVLDPTAFITLAADVATAEAMHAASAKDLARVAALHAQGQNASAQALELAQAAEQRDRIAVAAARARLQAGAGAALAQRTDLAEFLKQCAAGEASLARIDLLSGESLAGAPAGITVGPLAQEAAAHAATLIGPAPSADAQAQGAGYLVSWRGEALPPGTALRAFLRREGGETKTLTVPRSALVQHNGAVFVYVQTGEGVFARRLVAVRAEGRGESVAIAEGISEKDQVVSVGAQQLLSAELQAAAAAE